MRGFSGRFAVLAVMVMVVACLPALADEEEGPDEFTLNRWEYATRGVEFVSNCSTNFYGPWKGPMGIHWIDHETHEIRTYDGEDISNSSYYGPIPTAHWEDSFLTKFDIWNLNGTADQDLTPFSYVYGPGGGGPAMDYLDATFNEEFVIISGAARGFYHATILDMRQTILVDRLTPDRLSSPNVGNAPNVIMDPEEPWLAYRRTTDIVVHDLAKDEVLLERSTTDGPFYIGDGHLAHCQTQTNGSTRIIITDIVTGTGTDQVFPGIVYSMAFSKGNLMVKGNMIDGNRTYLLFDGVWKQLGHMETASDIAVHDGIFTWAEDQGNGTIGILVFDPSVDSDNDNEPDWQDEDDDNDGFDDQQELDEGTDPHNYDDNPLVDRADGRQNIGTFIFFAAAVLIGFGAILAGYVILFRRGQE